MIQKMAFTVARFSIVLVLMLASDVRAQNGSIEEDTDSGLESSPSPPPTESDTYWQVEWNVTSLAGSGADSEFAVTGQIVPGVDVPTMVDVAARSWNSDTLKEAVGEVCVAFGPIASQLLGNTVQGVCDPVLQSLRTGEPVEGISDVCQELWTEVEEEASDGLTSEYWNNILEYTVPYEDSYYQSNKGSRDQTTLGNAETGEASPDGWDFWNIPAFGYLYPSQFLQDVLGFSDDNQYETCNRLGAVVYNRSLSGRELIRNITSTALRRLVPLSLLSCGESSSLRDIHLGNTLLQVFSILSGIQDTQQFCEAAESLAASNGLRYDQLITASTDELLTALIDDTSKCSELLNRLESHGVWMSFHTEAGYDSIEIMCSNIQEMLQNPDAEFQFTSADMASTLGLNIIKVVRAAGGFLNSSTVRGGFVGLCRALRPVSSSADEMMCAALETDSSDELIRQCLALCGLDSGEGSAEDTDDPTDGSDTSKDPTEGSDASRDPTEGSETSRDPTEGSDASRDPSGGSDGSRDPTEGSDASRDPTEGSGASRDPTEGSDASRDPTEGSDASRDPSRGSDGSRDPTEGSDASRDPTEGSDASRDPTEGSDASRDPTEGSDASRDPTGGSDGSRDPTEGSDASRDPTEGSDASRDPTGGSDGSRDPTEGSDASRDPTEGSDASRDPTEGSDASRDPTEGSDASRDPTGGFDGSRDPTEGSDASRDPTEGSGLITIIDEGSGWWRDAVDEFGDSKDSAGDSDDLGGPEEGYFVPTEPVKGSGGRKDPAADSSGSRFPAEGSGWWRDPTEGSGGRGYPAESSGWWIGSGEGSGWLKRPGEGSGWWRDSADGSGWWKRPGKDSGWWKRPGEGSGWWRDSVDGSGWWKRPGQGSSGGWRDSAEGSGGRRDSDEGSGDWRDSADGSGLSGDSTDGSGWRGDGFIGPGGYFSHEELLKAWFSEWFDLMGDRDRDEYSLPVPDFKHLLQNILSIHDADVDSICERFGWKIHENTMTVRDVIIKILDSMLEALAYSIPELCEKDSFEGTDKPFTGGVPDPPVQSPKPSDEPSWYPDHSDRAGDDSKKSEWENVHLGPLSGNQVAGLLAVLGGYSSREEMCYSTRTQFYFDSLSERVTGMRNKLLEATRDERICTRLLSVINNDLDLFGDSANGFVDAASVCAEIKYAFGPHISEYLIDLFLEGPNLDGRGALLVAGRLFNSTIKEAALFPCIIYSGTKFDSLEMDRVCNLFHDPDPAGLIENCKQFFDDGEWLDENTDVDSWWPSFIPSLLGDKPWLLQMDFWLNGAMQGDLPSQFYHLFVDDGYSSPEVICEHAEKFVANRSLTMQFLFDRAMDATFRFFAHISPELCYGNDKDPKEEPTVEPTQNPFFESSPAPSWEKSIYRRMNLTDESTDFLGTLFTFLGHYENSDDLCIDSVGAVADDADPRQLNEIVDTMKQTFYDMMANIEVCETFMEIMQETYGDPFDMGYFHGFDNNRHLCQTIKESFNQETDISAIENLLLSGADQRDDRIFMSEAMIKAAGYLLNAGTFKDIVEDSCNGFDTTDGLGLFLGHDFYPLCEWASQPHSREAFLDTCLKVVQSHQEGHSDTDETDEENDSHWEGESPDEDILGWLRLILGNEDLSYEDFVSWVHEMLGIDISTDEQLCDGAKDIISNQEVTIKVIVDNIMDVALRLLANASPWLCNQGDEMAPPPTAAPGFNSSQISQWAESMMMMNMDMSEVDPITFLGDVMTFLGNYLDNDELCYYSIEAVAEGADPALLDGMIDNFKESMFSLLNNADHCTSFVDFIEVKLQIPFTLGDIIGFDSNRGLCEAIGRAFDRNNDEFIDLSILHTIIYPENDDTGSGDMWQSPVGSGDGDESPLIPEEWQTFIREMIKVAGRLYNAGTITDAISTTCDFFDQADVNIGSLVWEIGEVCSWSSRGSDLDEFYHVCLHFVELPWDHTPGADSTPWDEDESSDEDILGWLRLILGNEDLSYEDFVSWVHEMLGIDISTDEQLCNGAKDIISNQEVTIKVIVDNIMDVALRLLANASPWLCNQGDEMAPLPTAAPGFNSSQISQWAESMMMMNMDMSEVDPITFLGDVMTFLGNYQDSDELCYYSIEAVAEGADPALLDGMIDNFKESMFSLLNNADHCTSFVDFIEVKLQIPFTLGDIIGFDSNRGLCEAIGRAFDRNNDEFIDLSILHTIIYPENDDTGSGDMWQSKDESVDGDESPLIPEEWQTFIREMIKVAGRLYNAGTITDAISTTCDFFDQADVNIGSLVWEIGEVCSWSSRGSDLDEFYHVCLHFVELPWDHTPGADSTPWDEDESSDEDILGWLRLILGNEDLSYEDFVSWVHEMLGIDISTDEQLCNGAKDIISNQEVTIKVIVDNIMDVALRLLANASPWLCNQGDEMAPLPTAAPGFNSSQISQWAESMMMMNMDMSEVDPITFLGDVMTFLGNYQDSDELCYYSIEAVAEGADPALLDGMIDNFKESMFSLLNNADHCTSFVDFIEVKLQIPFTLGDIIGFDSNRGLCEAIGRAFDRNNDEFIDLSILHTIIYPENDDTGSGDMWQSKDESVDGDESPLIPEEWQTFIREMIKVAGRLYNAGTITDAISTTCDFFDQADVNIGFLVWEIGEVCSWSSRGSDLDEFYQTCVEFIELPWDNTPPAAECQDGWWSAFLFQAHVDNEEALSPDQDSAVSNPADESTDFSKGSLNHFIEAIKYVLYSQLESNPFAVCRTFRFVIEADTTDVVQFAKSAARPILSSLHTDAILSAKCMKYYGNASAPEFNPPGFTVFNDTERLVSVLTGNFATGGDFCGYILSFTDEDERKTSVFDAMVDGAFNVMNDVSLCNSSLHLLPRDWLEAFSGITGFEDVYSFCGYLYNSFNDRTNVTLSELQLPDGFQLSTYTPSEGELLPGVNFRDAVSFAGALLTTTKFKDSLTLACDVLSPLFTDSVYPGFGHAVSVCDAINSNDTRAAVLQCEELLVPIVFGDDFPIALRQFDVGQILLDIVLPLFNYEPRFEKDTICPAIETVLNSDMSPVQLATAVVDGLLESGIEYGAGVCQDLERVYSHLAPDVGRYTDPSTSHYDIEFVRELEYFQQTFSGTFKFASTMTGFNDSGLMCDALIVAASDQEAFGNLVELIRERVFSYLTDEEECKIAVRATMAYINLVESEAASDNLLYQLTGYYSPQAFCIASTAAFRGEILADTECEGILDCANVCNGEATLDCTGFCGGSAQRDCDNVCNGAATLNSCNVCVGGTTQLGDDQGKDPCGVCWSATDYRITWDCHGTCYGNASLDACKVCVGGETGRLANYSAGSIDCRGVCGGTWKEDSCGYCEPFDESSIGVTNKYQDCNHDCFTPGASSNRAELNECDICYGGNTGLNATAGMNACGQCLTDSSADESSCLGCDGVHNSGKVLDACGVCDGNGTTCFGVGWVDPSLVSENSDTQLDVYGAGFEAGSSLVCIFEASDGTQTSSETQYLAFVLLTCNVPGLAPGDYKVKMQRDGIISDSVYGDLTVQQEIEILTVSPSEVTINSSVASISVTVTATEGAFASVKAAGTVPYLIVEGDYDTVVPGSFDDTSDNIMLFAFPMPSSSVQVTVFPSLNAVEKLTTPGGAGFVLTAYYPAPEFTEAYFASTGAAVVTRFSSGVNFNEFAGCDDVFEDTSKLGDNAICRWVGSTVMYIILGTGSDLLTVGDELVIKTDTVKAFRENYSRYVSGSLAVAGPTNPVMPTVVLNGKERITSCGTVQVTGRRTQGGAGRDMVYTWAVSSVGETSDVEALVADENGVDLVVPGSLMDAETIYSFSLTAENFLGQSHTSYLNTSRSDQAVPEVEITVRGVDPDNVLVSNSFDLTAQVTFYSDCVPPGDTVFSWSVDNADIPLNLKTINRRTLHVDPNTLPGDTTVTFTVIIYKSSEPENNITQSVSVQTKYSDLIPIIYGGSELTVGRDSGLLVLDGSGSLDLDQVATDMVYQWQCRQVTDSTACWSFKEGEEGSQFPSTEAAPLSQLSISASSMEADKTYEFTLEVFKLTRSASTSIRVIALNGDSPKVDISTTFSERILAEDSLSLMATISHDLPLSTYVWESVGTDEGYAFLDLSDTSNLAGAPSLYPYSKSNGSISFLTIQAGKLTAGSTYQIQLTVTAEDGQYGIAKMQFTVVEGVTSCVFSLNSISSYTELDTVMYTIDNCVADESAYPLSYRVFLVDGSRRQTITEQTNSPAIRGVGKTVTDEGATSNTFVAEVCDAYDSCSYFYHTVDVSELSQCTEQSLLQLVEDLVTVEKYKQNFANALINYNEVQAKCTNETASARRRRRWVAVETETSATAEEQLSLVQSSMDSTVLDTTSAQLLIDQCNYIVTDALSDSDKSTFVDNLVELVAVFETAGEPLPDDSASIVLDKATEIRRSLNSTLHSTLLATVTSLTDSLSAAQTSQLQLGAQAVETSSSTMTSSVQRAIPTGVFSTKTSGGHAVDFGTVFSSRFSADWACSSGTCSGVTVSFQHWETGQDELSITSEDIANVAADIMDIQLLDPSSGEELSIANLTERISINLTVSQPQAGKTYECRYWDTSNLVWSDDGLETVSNSDSSSSVVECLTDHLTSFTLLAVDGPTTGPATAGATELATEDPTANESDVATTENSEPIEVPETETSSTVIIVVVVCVVVVIALALVIGAVVIVKTKKNGKVAAIDTNGNTNDPESPRGQPEEPVTPRRTEQWASQRPVTPRRSPTPAQQGPASPPEQQQPTAQTVHVVTVPVALDTAPLHSLPPPSSLGLNLVADMGDAAPPPVYIPPTQNYDTTLTLTEVS